MKYVSLIQSGKIVTSVAQETRHYADQAELIQEVETLIREGFAFVDQPGGWPPAAILKDLHEKRLLKRAFIAITWRAPNDFRTYEIAPC
jgi:hypothetical protein